MVVNTAFLAMWVVGAIVVLLVMFLVARARPWYYPVREVSFDFGVRERTTQLLSRGPSGKEEGDVEAEETEGPKTLWERMKNNLYTYPKRPSKVR